MEYYTLIKVAHSLPALLLLLGMLAHVFMLFKAYRGGDAVVLARKLRVTRCYSLPALGVLALASVVMAHLGARAAHRLDTRRLKKVFAVLLYGLAASMLWRVLGH